MNAHGLIEFALGSDQHRAIIKLNWKGSEPGVDPFTALNADEGQALISAATCSAKTDEELSSAVKQLVQRAALLARRLASHAERTLFLWDPVYAEMTIVYTDEAMLHDGPLVTKCKFPLLDEQHSVLSQKNEELWETETERLSHHLCQTIEREVSVARFPSKMSVYFSDQDRSSFGADEFPATRVSSEWQPV